MAHEKLVYGFMQKVGIADKHIVGDYLAHLGIYPQEGVSKVNNAYKILNSLVEEGKLEKGDGYYRLKGGDGEFKPHSMKLSKCLTEITKLGLETKIVREKKIETLGLIPDAVVLLKKDNKFLCFVLEVCLNETPEYLKQKVNIWLHYEKSKELLSELLGTEIKAFDIVVSGMEAENTFEFNSYLEAING